MSEKSLSHFDVHHSLGAAELVERALQQREGTLADTGALAVRTGKFTGRSPKDKYIVDEPSCHEQIWWGQVNQPLSEAAFDRLHEKVVRYLRGRETFVQALYGGADARYRLPVRVVTEHAWQSLFARQLLVRPDMFAADEVAADMHAAPDRPWWDSLDASGRADGHTHVTGDGTMPLTILVAPGCRAQPEEDGTRSETFIVLHLRRRVVLIGGTEYAGEIKKSVFSFLNYLLPQQGVFPMHCSANVGKARGNTSLFFGLSGTGKTTLSASPTHRLIGDDEHGWSDEGVFNFEGGCYAKCIRLSQEAEPEIWSAIRFGSVLENVVLDARRRADFNDDQLTENTRVAYPIEYIPNALIPGIGAHPRHVVFLTADAFGVLPPISRLTPAQARFHFVSGYTAKLAGTERGLGKEPEATFSTCFAQPFLPLPPALYSRMLDEKLARHGATVWLVNTGWTGGPYGVGARMNIHYTREMVDAAIEGELDGVEFREEPVFGLHVPLRVPHVPREVLDPRATWADKAAYDRQARHLAMLFVQNFERHRASVAPEVAAAAPQV